MLRLWLIFFILLITPLLIGCHRSTQIEYPTFISASESINPDIYGRPSPVVINVYQLHAATKFKAAEYFDIINHPEKNLSDELITIERIEIRPGEKLNRKLKVSKKTKFLGFIFSYRDLSELPWRKIITIAKTHCLSIGLEDNHIKVATKSCNSQ